MYLQIENRKNAREKIAIFEKKLLMNNSFQIDLNKNELT
jgi:hypothetical protein